METESFFLLNPFHTVWHALELVRLLLCSTLAPLSAHHLTQLQLFLIVPSAPAERKTTLSFLIATKSVGLFFTKHSWKLRNHSRNSSPIRVFVIKTSEGLLSVFEMQCDELLCCFPGPWGVLYDVTCTTSVSAVAFNDITTTVYIYVNMYISARSLMDSLGSHAL